MEYAMCQLRMSIQWKETRKGEQIMFHNVSALDLKKVGVAYRTMIVFDGIDRKYENVIVKKKCSSHVLLKLRQNVIVATMFCLRTQGL
jgi:hypothetical protein